MEKLIKTGEPLMKLNEVRIRNYRCIIDSDWFKIEDKKTILVGKNESGKSVILRALQHLNRDKNRKKISKLEDYPRHLVGQEEYDQSEEVIVSAKFKLETHERKLLSKFLGSPEVNKDENVEFLVNVNLNNKAEWEIVNSHHTSLEMPFKKSIITILTPAITDINSDIEVYRSGLADNSSSLAAEDWQIVEEIKEALAEADIDRFFSSLKGYLEVYDKIQQEMNDSEYNNVNTDNMRKAMGRVSDVLDQFTEYQSVGNELFNSVPQFVFFSEYYQIDSEIYLDDLLGIESRGVKKRRSQGNFNLIRALGCTVKELSEQGREDRSRDEYNKKKNQRQYKLNNASRGLTKKIKDAWQPDKDSLEARYLRVTADGQRLKFEVSEDNDTWIEFDRRSNGYQWLVSFYITLITEAKESYKNAIFLLDEPGLSLHGLKQVKFRETLSKLAETNQTIYTTHSPFLVGSNELEIVRVVELKEKEKGTKVYNNLRSQDPASIFPLHAALGYNISSSLFSQERNFVVEGYTDYLYIDTTAIILRNNKKIKLNDKISILPANTANFVPIYAAILLANDLKVGVLLDSDPEGDIQAERDELMEYLGEKKILRVGDFLEQQSDIKVAQIEDMLRDTLAVVASDKYQMEELIDIIREKPSESIVYILKDKLGNRFRKYDLAKAYLKWTKEKEADDLSEREVKQWTKLIKKMNQILK